MLAPPRSLSAAEPVKALIELANPPRQGDNVSQSLQAQDSRPGIAPNGWTRCTRPSRTAAPGPLKRLHEPPLAVLTPHAVARPGMLRVRFDRPIILPLL
jgi:hypothetical protein